MTTIERIVETIVITHLGYWNVVKWNPYILDVDYLTRGTTHITMGKALASFTSNILGKWPPITLLSIA